MWLTANITSCKDINKFNITFQSLHYENHWLKFNLDALYFSKHFKRWVQTCTHLDSSTFNPNTVRFIKSFDNNRGKWKFTTLPLVLVTSELVYIGGPSVYNEVVNNESQNSQGNISKQKFPLPHSNLLFKWYTKYEASTAITNVYGNNNKPSLEEQHYFIISRGQASNSFMYYSFNIK